MWFIDLFFDNYKWYRKVIGGQWYGYHYSIHHFFWERGEAPVELPHFGTIKTEDYTKNNNTNTNNNTKETK